MKRAKILLEEARLSQEEVGTALGVDRSAVAHFLNKRDAYMRADRLAAFAGLLAKKLRRSITIEDLLIWVEVEEIPVGS